MLTLRPHHLICLHFYVGKGYSTEFVENMDDIWAAIGHGESITITDGADDVCLCCPHNRNGICSTSEKVNRYDGQVRSLLGISTGDCVDYACVEPKIESEILTSGKLSKICHDCQWYEICKEANEREKE